MSKPINRKSIQDRLSESTPGATATEEGGIGRAGLYRHPESGQEAHTLSDPLFGEAQSNAFEQLGFVRIRDTRPDEIKSIVDYSVAANVGQTDSLKGLSARLDQLEGVASDNKRLEAEVAKLRAEAAAKVDPNDVTVQETEKARLEAEAPLKARGQAGDDDEEEDEKPVSQQNETELKATAEAEAEGVDLSEATTVKTKRAAILAAREGKKESEKE